MSSSRLTQLREEVEEWIETGEPEERSRELLMKLIEELEQVHARNDALRRAALKTVSKDNRMSTKLRDALYE
ncbi:hypothetical protein Q5741_01805 [Paenibacillus sp. JX-17]|uniref:Ni2+-binding GTPase n=1 Tax=Paenibacillus lacisoli TaxID=3064525 RepID=A0ABT9C7A9_9BACL|nr:hypothetical protein [Paenibacillus sp. JX-17]MDO7905147.1 hypothetical protein [Paenibacillus sp. JX-17]